MNIWTGIGRLGADPEVKFSNSGTAICNFTIAIGKKYKSKGKMIDEVSWISCTAFGKTAENAQKYLFKGSEVAITGELKVQSWEDNEGKKRQKMIVIVHPFGLQFLSKTNKSREETRVENQETADDQDIPF